MTKFTLMFIFVMTAISPLKPSHDSWIDKGGFRNTAGEWCCGEKDCAEVDDKVRETPGGYKLTDTGETVPWGQVQPSRDTHYWRCHKLTNGVPMVRCFFAPHVT